MHWALVYSADYNTTQGISGLLEWQVVTYIGCGVVMA